VRVPDPAAEALRSMRNWLSKSDFSTELLVGNRTRSVPQGDVRLP
jgi:hypothetical protein